MNPICASSARMARRNSKSHRKATEIHNGNEVFFLWLFCGFLLHTFIVNALVYGLLHTISASYRTLIGNKSHRKTTEMQNGNEVLFLWLFCGFLLLICSGVCVCVFRHLITQWIDLHASCARILATAKTLKYKIHVCFFILCIIIYYLYLFVLFLWGEGSSPTHSSHAGFDPDPHPHPPLPQKK